MTHAENIERLIADIEANEAIIDLNNVRETPEQEAAYAQAWKRIGASASLSRASIKLLRDIAVVARENQRAGRAWVERSMVGDAPFAELEALEGASYAADDRLDALLAQLEASDETK